MATKLSKDEELAIKQRTDKALEYLKENDLTLDAVVYSTSLGRNEQGHAVFGTAVVPFLQDTRFSMKDMVSPIQPKDIKPDDIQETT